MAKPSLPTIPEEEPADRLRRARNLRRLFLAALFIFIGLGAFNVFGVQEATVTASRGEYHLTVTYAPAARPGLAAPWQVELRRPGGFARPVTVTSTRSYFDIFDENGTEPEPADATSDWVVWEFEPTGDEVLLVSLDARTQPTLQRGRAARTRVEVEGGPAFEVSYRTRVMP